MSAKKKVSRRKFIVRAGLGGVGVLLGATYFGRHALRRSAAELFNTLEPPYRGNTKDPMIWFEVKPDNQLIFYSPKVEMGQGTFTGLTQIAADELEVDIEQIQVLHAPTITGNVDGLSTGGSTSISSLWQPLRELSATFREMLINEAANQWQAETSSLKVKSGVVQHPDGRKMTYGEIAASGENWKVPKTPQLKEVSSYKYVGKPIARVDLKDKVLGASIFGLDASMPDMLFGAVARPHLIGARFVSADITEAEKMPGVVKVVQESDFVGVVAQTRMQAENAKNKLQVNWETDKNWQSEDIESMIKVGQGKAVEIQKRGKAEKILDDTEDVIQFEFTSPIGAHAQLEPNGAVADVKDDSATVMISTQVVKVTQKEVADRLGLKDSQVNVIPTYLGGGFGRRLHTPNAVQAAVLSRAVGKPVKCFFNRKDEFQQDTFRPPTHHIVRAKLKEDGYIEAIEHQVSSGDVMFGSAITPGFIEPIIGADVGAWRGGMIQYRAIPNFRAVSWRVQLPFATSFWRSLGLLANTFAIESTIDELAVRAGIDPVQYRLDQIQDDEAGYRLKEVIKKAREMSNWKDGVHNGRAMGFAASTDANTPVAQVAEVSLEGKEIKVHKVHCCIDPGMAVNPDQVKAQCEGSIIMGMSGSMFEKMEVKDGELGPTIYGPYRMARMKHAPKEIQVEILENGEAPGAVGEPPLGPIAAAVSNAVYRLTGQRLTSMPLTIS